MSLKALGALAAALGEVPAYNQPTLLHAVRSIARGPGGEPVRLAEVLSPRHVGPPTAFLILVASFSIYWTFKGEDEGEDGADAS